MKRPIRNLIFAPFNYLINLLFPLATIPLLTSRLGTEQFGAYVVLLSVAMALSVFCDYGFTLKGAVYYKKEGRVCFWKIMRFRVFLLLIALFFALSVYGFSGYLVIFLLPISHIIFPSWYYYSAGHASKTTLPNITGKIMSVLLLYGFVEDQSDIYIALTLQALPQLISGALCLIFVRVPFSNGTIVESAYLKSNFSVALMTLCFALYTSSATFFAEKFYAPELLAAFFVVDRLMRISVQFFNSVGPFLQANFDFLVSRKSVVIYVMAALIFSTCCIGAVSLFYRDLFNFLGVDPGLARQLFLIQSPIIFLVIATTFLTLHFIFPIDERVALFVAICSALFFLSGTVVGSLLETHQWYFSGLLVATEFLAFLMSVYYVMQWHTSTRLCRNSEA